MKTNNGDFIRRDGNKLSSIAAVQETGADCQFTISEEELCEYLVIKYQNQFPLTDDRKREFQLVRNSSFPQPLASGELLLGDQAVLGELDPTSASRVSPYFGSSGRFAFFQASNPPLSARTFFQPFSISTCATRALEASFGHVQ